MQRAYTDGPDGQVHLRVWKGGDENLVCLHPAPYSGDYFATLAPRLTGRYRVIAPDYPGYGGSDPVEGGLTINHLARVMLAAIDAAADRQSVSVLGFHTGCLVAVELALIAPERVAEIILIDVPYFTAEKQAAFREALPVPMPLDTTLEAVAKYWESDVTKRIDDSSPERTWQLFAEHVRPGPHMNDAFAAAFSYPCADQFAKVGVPTRIIATQSGLLEPTRAAAAAIQDAKFTELLTIDRGALEFGAPAIAETLLR